jgi:FMN phosphatase YigB (HAD superfamily)
MKLIIWDFRNTIYNIEDDKFGENALELLTAFHKNCKQVLASTVSSKNFGKRLDLIKKLGIDVFFDEIHIGRKDSDIFNDFLRKYGTSPKNTYVIGDNAYSEISIGNKLGMKTILLKNKSSRELEEKPWKTINSLLELKDLIDEE